MARWMVMAALILATGAAMPAWADDREDCDNGAILAKTEPARVFAACRRLAEQGGAAEEAHLGFMYANGLGVAQDYAAAAKWFHKAADQGYATAQNNLGMMYATGQGVAKDLVQAYMLFDLSAAQGNASAAKNRDFLSTKMTPSQIEKAQALAAAWKPATGQ
jgi:TPR repeat protein